MFKFRKALSITVLTFAGVCLLGSVAMAAAPIATDAAHAVSQAAVTAPGDPGNEFTMKGMIALAAGLGLGLAAFGGAMAQGRAASAALEGIARNPGAADKLFTPMILGLALIESLVIYSLLISFLLYGKL
ncbi:MAG: F-type H+-transporting ATPase subunit c [Myxococcota bacterium]|jgi:F-type H+-transporting ATPase subunit c